MWGRFCWTILTFIHHIISDLIVFKFKIELMIVAVLNYLYHCLYFYELKNMFSRIFIYRHIWRIIYGWWLWKLCSSNIFFVLAGSWQSLQYECPTCGVSASKKQNLKTHIESAHWKSKLTRLNCQRIIYGWWCLKTV